MNATEEALARAYARAQVFGGLAAERVGEAAQYVSTPMVARDMLSITRAHGRDKLLYWGFRSVTQHAIEGIWADPCCGAVTELS